MSADTRTKEEEVIAVLQALQLERREEGASGDAGQDLEAETDGFLDTSSEGEEGEAEVYDREKELDKAMAQIFSFLDVRSLRKIRLVCKKWNELVLPLFPSRRVALNIKQSTKGAVLPIEPRLFGRLHLGLDCVKGLELAVKGRSCGQVRHLTVWGPQGMSLVTKGINAGAFRNISTLIFATTGFEHIYAGCFHTVPEMCALPTLTTLKLRTDPGHKKSCNLYRVNQCLINTAPNLRRLESHQVFNLQNKKYLTHLILELTEEIQRARTLHEMLDAVKNTLTHLEMRDVPPGSPMPVMENVRYLSILSASGENKWEFAALFPNLKKFKNRVFAFENNLVTSYIKTGPQHLRFFETHCCFSSKDPRHAVLKNVARSMRQYLPNLEVFKIQTSCPLSTKRGGSHLLNIIVNLSFKHVIVMDLRVAFNIVEVQKNLINQLMNAKVKPLPDAEKGDLLEFRGGPWDQITLRNSKGNSEEENKEVVANFPTVVMELGKRWKSIHFKYVRFDRTHIEGLKHAMHCHSLPVEIYYAHGSEHDSQYHMDRDVYYELMEMAHYVRTEHQPPFDDILNKD